ncbi:hypothetical protein [Enterococcus phage vB_Efm3_KEN20]
MSFCHHIKHGLSNVDNSTFLTFIINDKKVINYLDEIIVDNCINRW